MQYSTEYGKCLPPFYITRVGQEKLHASIDLGLSFSDIATVTSRNVESLMCGTHVGLDHVGPYGSHTSVTQCHENVTMAMSLNLRPLICPFHYLWHCVACVYVSNSKLSGSRQLLLAHSSFVFSRYGRTVSYQRPDSRTFSMGTQWAPNYIWRTVQRAPNLLGICRYIYSVSASTVSSMMSWLCRIT